MIPLGPILEFLKALPWKWIGIGLAVAGLLLAVHHDGAVREGRKWQALITAERAAADKAAADFAAKSAAKDAANAELSRDLEATRAKAIADADASSAAFDERLRNVRKARSGCVPAAAPNPGIPAQPATGGDGGRGGVDPASSLRTVVLALQADVKECVGWANKIGR